MHMLAWYRWGPVPSRDGRPRGRDRWEDGSQAWHGSRRHRPSSRVTGLPNVIGSRPRPDRIDARSAALRPGVRPLWSRSCEPTRRSRRTASRLSTKSRTGWLALGMWLAGDGFHLIAVRDEAVPAFIQVAREQRSAADLAGRAERQARPAPGAPPPGPRHPLYSVAGRARSIATTRNRRRTPAPSSSVIKTRPG